MGTPLVGDAPRLLLLGSGEIGREVAIEAIRLGAEVIAVDRYPMAPAMQVAHRHHVVPMTDPAALRAIVRRESPDVIVPEIEQIATDELVRLEADGWTVVPGAEATRVTMNRERIRRLAAERAKVPTSRFEFADSLPEAERQARAIGFPCVFKAIMSSSGHGMTVVREPQAVAAAYAAASQHGRVANPRVMIEEFIAFDAEVTMLTLRHYGEGGDVTTSVLDPIGHERPGTLYHESWQPAGLPPHVRAALARVAQAVTGELGGVGIFGVECFVAGGSVFFSEVSPRPHDTGLVTLVSQSNSEFALHARAVLGLPYVGPETARPSAAHVILSPGTGWAPEFGGFATALAAPGVRVHLFGKPEAYPDRRLGVALVAAGSVDAARAAAARAAHAIEPTIRFPAEEASPGRGRTPAVGRA
ncbi:MAG TPA: formate-dependent phosphoribosylglycinamide formyltransferase [Thermoplasmata archaeon]|nr:formate-dependent phosphoribosylglycinamide formyltransferase [Thermoplasmata archaeon]